MNVFVNNKKIYSVNNLSEAMEKIEFLFPSVNNENNENIYSISYDTSRVFVITKFYVLQCAVYRLYYAGKWHCDLSDELSQELWENVRDAAGFTPGESPTALAV